MGAAVNRILVAHQPNYLPWLGYFHKVAHADVFVVGDDVQYAKHGLINRNRIRTRQGWQWLTVPVLTKGRSGQRVNEVVVDDVQRWRRKHWQAIQWNYQTAPYFDSYAGFLEEIYAKPWEKLVDLSMTLIRFLLEQFRIEVAVRRSSRLALRPERTLRLVDMTLACDCTVYLGGTGASRSYTDEHVFREAELECRFSDFVHPTYQQCFPGFEPNMSALDLLFNRGEASREVLC